MLVKMRVAFQEFTYRIITIITLKHDLKTILSPPRQTGQFKVAHHLRDHYLHLGLSQF